MATHRRWALATFALAGCVGACVITPPDDPNVQTGCAADDPRVGQTAVLQGYFHNVQGTARIIDNCTIVIEHFTYDGGGLDVRVVGIKNSDFANPIILSQGIRREGGYEDETLTVHLPVGVTLDDVPRISICCLNFNINFGDGVFQ